MQDMAKSGHGSMSLTLGPVYFNWPTLEWADFYARVADEAPVDRVIVGEVICSKRTPFRVEVLAAAIERLERGGKEVVVATLALPTLKRELAEIADTAAAPYLVEVNDISALAAMRGRACVLGPLVNVYNEDTLAEVAKLGAECVCLPPELPLESVAALAASSSSVELEVFAFGRAPLAISARCYHARAHATTKDACRFVCERDPDGLDVETLDRQPFLAINGLQTIAGGITLLTHEVSELRAVGVRRLRLSPQSCDMIAVARCYRDLADGRIDAGEALAALLALRLPAPPANGYLHGAPGANWITSTPGGI